MDRFMSQILGVGYRRSSSREDWGRARRCMQKSRWLLVLMLAIALISCGRSRQRLAGIQDRCACSATDVESRDAGN